MIELATPDYAAMTAKEAVLELEVALRRRWGRRLKQAEIAPYVEIGPTSISGWSTGASEPCRAARERINIALKALRGDFGGPIPVAATVADDVAAIRAVVYPFYRAPSAAPSKPKGWGGSLGEISERVKHVEAMLEALLAEWKGKATA